MSRDTTPKNEDKKAEEAPSPSTPKAEAESGSRSSVSLGKIGDPMPKSVEVTGSNTAKFAETKEAVVKDLNIPSDISSVIKAAELLISPRPRSLSLAPKQLDRQWQGVVLIVSNDGFKNIRAFSKNDDGELILKNESFKVYDKEGSWQDARPPDQTLPRPWCCSDVM